MRAKCCEQASAGRSGRRGGRSLSISLKVSRPADEDRGRVAASPRGVAKARSPDASPAARVRLILEGDLE